MKEWIKTNRILLLIILIAAIFRFFQINNLPAGLFPDEAAYGMDGRSITRGDYQPFFERGNGREGLFMYFLAAAISIFGYAPWVNHLVSASFGLAAVIAAFYLTRKMFGLRTAYLAAFLMAISSYAVTMTRTAFRANTVPFFTTITLLFAIKSFTDESPRKRLWSALWTGVFFSAGFYTYISYRMMLPLLLGFWLVLIFANRHQLLVKWNEYKGRILAFKAGLLVTIAWIAYYWFVSHPGSFVGRAGQVSVFSPDLNKGDLVGTVIDVFVKTILSFFTLGDLNWRHNVSGYPHLSHFISPFFALALIAFTYAIFVLAKQAWQKNIQSYTLHRALLACWFWLMLVPELTTAEGIPHGLRLIGTIPVIFIITARGMIWVWRRIPQRFRVQKEVIAAAFIATLLIYNFYLYFSVAANSPEYYYSFRSDLTTVSKYINEVNQKDSTYLSLDAFSVQTVDYLTTPTNQPYILLVPEKSFELVPKPGDVIIFTQSTLPDAEKFVKYNPEVKKIGETQNKFGQIIMVVYQR